MRRWVAGITVTELVESHNREPKLVVALEYQHHHVAASDTERLEERCRAVALALDVGKCELYLLSPVVGP